MTFVGEADAEEESGDDGMMFGVLWGSWHFHDVQWPYDPRIDTLIGDVN